MAELPPEILLVEDNPDDVMFVVQALSEGDFGVRLEVAHDGAEALAFIFGSAEAMTAVPVNRPRLIIVDLKLPKVSGLEFLRRVKANPHTQSIPVVVLSSSQERRDVNESYQFGVNSFLVKPMDFEQFGEKVRMLCQYWLQLNQPPKP